MGKQVNEHGSRRQTPCWNNKSNNNDGTNANQYLYSTYYVPGTVLRASRTLTDSLNPHKNPTGLCYYHPHFIDGDTSTERLRALPKVTTSQCQSWDSDSGSLALKSMLLTIALKTNLEKYEDLEISTYENFCKVKEK